MRPPLMTAVWFSLLAVPVPSMMLTFSSSIEFARRRTNFATSSFDPGSPCAAAVRSPKVIAQDGMRTASARASQRTVVSALSLSSFRSYDVDVLYRPNENSTQFLDFSKRNILFLGLILFEFESGKTKIIVMPTIIASSRFPNKPKLLNETRRYPAKTLQHSHRAGVPRLDQALHYLP